MKDIWKALIIAFLLFVIPLIWNSITKGALIRALGGVTKDDLNHLVITLGTRDGSNRELTLARQTDEDLHRHAVENLVRGRCPPLWPGDLRNDGGSVPARISFNPNYDKLGCWGRFRKKVKFGAGRANRRFQFQKSGQFFFSSRITKRFPSLRVSNPECASLRING